MFFRDFQNFAIFSKYAFASSIAVSSTATRSKHWFSVDLQLD